MQNLSAYFTHRTTYITYINHITYIFYCLLASMLLISCTNNNVADLEQFVHNKRTQAPGKIPPLPRMQNFETYAYKASTLRNPFMLGKDGTAKPVDECPQIIRAKTPLEQSPLDSLTMVGSLTQNNEKWVLIKDQENNVHRVKKGHFLGQNNGKIINITDSEVVLQELVSDRLQGCIKRQTILAISE